MNRRWLLSKLFGAGAIGLTSLAARRALADDEGHEPDHEVSECAKLAARCATQCAACSKHCADLLAEGHDRHESPMKHCIDCADICSTTAKVAAREGALMAVMCQACAAACSQCASACRVAPEDRHMAACREACLKCAKACREMVEKIRGAAKDQKE